MIKQVGIFNDFLKRFGIYQEFYRELRTAQPDLPRVSDEMVEFPSYCSSRDYIVCLLDWNRTRRGPHFWALMHETWKYYLIEHL